ENPDPLSYCQGQHPWADFLIYNPLARKCLRFAQLGGGTGLAYYRARYFGFRPFDGQVIDLMAATMSDTYFVDEAGTVDGTNPVFPSYKMDNLRNADDITVIGDQVYYVALGSAQAHIGVLDKSTSTLDRKVVCPIGAMGYGQSYEGIAALGSSTPLIPEAGDGITTRMATFF